MTIIGPLEYCVLPPNGHLMSEPNVARPRSLVDVISNKGIALPVVLFLCGLLC